MSDSLPSVVWHLNPTHLPHVSCVQWWLSPNEKLEDKIIKMYSLLQSCNVECYIFCSIHICALSYFFLFFSFNNSCFCFFTSAWLLRCGVLVWLGLSHANRVHIYFSKDKKKKDYKNSFICRGVGLWPPQKWQSGVNGRGGQVGWGDGGDGRAIISVYLLLIGVGGGHSHCKSTCFQMGKFYCNTNFELTTLCDWLTWLTVTILVFPKNLSVMPVCSLQYALLIIKKRVYRWNLVWCLFL